MCGAFAVGSQRVQCEHFAADPRVGALGRAEEAVAEAEVLWGAPKAEEVDGGGGSESGGEAERNVRGERERKALVKFAAAVVAVEFVEEFVMLSVVVGDGTAPPAAECAHGAVLGVGLKKPKRWDKAGEAEEK